MTLREALNFKISNHKKIFKYGHEIRLYIVPDAFNSFEDYIKYHVERRKGECEVLKFKSEMRYRIYGLWSVNDSVYFDKVC